MKRTDAALQKARALVWHPGRVAAVVLSLGLLMAVAVATMVDVHQQAERDKVFEALTLRATDQLRIRMRGYAYGLRGTRSVILAVGSKTIRRHQFHEYLASRHIDQEFPGVLGYGFVRRVPAGTEFEFLRKARADGAPNLVIREFSPNPGERWIIQYLESSAGSASAIGLDLASESNRRNTIRQAINSGEATLTPPITLVQAKSRPARGFLIVLPVYASSDTPATVLLRQQYAVGLTYTPFLIDKVLSDFDLYDDAFSMTIRVRSANNQLATAFSSRHADQPASKGLIRSQTLSLYGQQWQLEFKARPNFIRSMHHVSPPFIVIQIAFISALLAALIYAYLTSRQRSLEDWLDKARLGGIIRNANDAIIGLDLTGGVTSWSRAAQSIFGYAEAEAVGRRLSELIVPRALQGEHESLLERVSRGESVPNVITRRCCQREHDIDVGITAFPITDEREGVVGAAMVIRDVSQQVASEERVRLLNANLEGQVSLRTAELELARRDLQTIFDAMPAMIGYWDKHQLNRVANKAYQQSLQCTDQPLQGMHMRDWLGETAYEESLPYIQGALRGEQQVFERTLMSADGQHQRHTQAHYLPDIVQGEILGFYVIINDVTEVTESRLQLESLLRHNEILLSTISQQMLYSVTDRQGRILEVNDNFCRVSGYSREELLGQNHRMINSTHHGSEFWHDMWRTISSGKAWHHEVCNRSKSGDLYWVDSVMAPFIGPSGAIERFVSLRTDITQRKQAEAELTRVADLLSNVLNAASEMSIIATDKQGVITLFNAGAESLLGYQASELIGVRRVSELHSAEEITARGTELSEICDEPVQGFRVLVHQPERVGAEVREWDYLRKQGTRVRVSLAVTVMRDRDGNITGYLAIAQDITQRIEKDHALQEAKQFAEQANEAKSSFLANMSHEIRTPMNGIMGLCYMLEQQSMPAASHNLVQKIQSASQSLLGIINDVLDFSKIEANRLEIELIPFRLSALIDDLAGIARGTLRDKDVELVISPVPAIVDYVLGDQLRVGQVLTNLLSNAVKFTQHGRIELAVSVLAAPDADSNIRVQFLIRDSGIGISEDKLQLIFDAFSQADTSTSRSYGGTGLGLTICRTLTELMGGKIEVSSVMGEGSCFRVELPLKLAPDALINIHSHGDAHAEAGPDHGKRLLGLRILIADDSELNREVAEFILNGEGASVETVPDGQAAVNLILGSANTYDVVLMDIQMPILDGYDATRAIRAIPLQQGLPVIALTAGAMASQRKAALEAGMNGFVAKPFNVDQLVATVRAHARKPAAAPVVAQAGMDAELNDAIQAFKQRFLSNRLPNHLQQLQAYLASEAGASQASLRAALHSMAGEAGMVDLAEIGDVSRHLETLIDGQEISEESLRNQVLALTATIETAIAHAV
ncbi:MAG: PAS domain S-box protein [Pseudomonadota bacterium]